MNKLTQEQKRVKPINAAPYSQFISEITPAVRQCRFVKDVQVAIAQEFTRNDGKEAGQ